MNKNFGRNIAQTAIIMAILTVGAKLFGFVREIVIAGLYGTSYVVDAYVISISIPEIVFSGIFVSIATAYIPLLSKKIEKDGVDSGNLFTSQMLNLLMIVALLASLLGLIFSEQIVNVFSMFSDDFPKRTADLTSIFIKITFSYAIFSSIAGLMDSFLQYKGVFLSQIVVGYIQNTVIICIIILSFYTSAYYLPVGMLLSYIIRAVCFYLLAKKHGFKYSGSFKLMEITKTILPLAIPVFIGTSIGQLNLFVDKVLGASLKEGSVAALNYANLLNSMILAVTITVLTTIIYPKIARASALADYDKFNEISSTGISLIVIIALPFSLGAMVYSQDIVNIVFARGAFSLEAVMLTSSAYFYYSIGLVFLALNNFMLRVYYSLHDMKTPMIFAGISLIIDIVLSLLLIGALEHNGLAIATSLSTISNTIMLYWGIKVKHSKIELIKEKKKIAKIMVATIVAVILSFLFYTFVSKIITEVIIIKLGVSILGAIVAYAFLLKLFKVEELKLIKSLIKK